MVGIEKVEVYLDVGQSGMSGLMGMLHCQRSGKPFTA
jgi:hypothetical protein